MILRLTGSTPTAGLRSSGPTLPLLSSLVRGRRGVDEREEGVQGLPSPESVVTLGLKGVRVLRKGSKVFLL